MSSKAHRSRSCKAKLPQDHMGIALAQTSRTTLVLWAQASAWHVSARVPRLTPGFGVFSWRASWTGTPCKSFSKNPVN